MIGFLGKLVGYDLSPPLSSVSNCEAIWHRFMPNDEQSIHDLIAEWLSATANGDLSKILPLMAEDVVFLIAGQPPMPRRPNRHAGGNRHPEVFEFLDSGSRRLSPACPE